MHHAARWFSRVHRDKGLASNLSWPWNSQPSAEGVPLSKRHAAGRRRPSGQELRFDQALLFCEIIHPHAVRKHNLLMGHQIQRKTKRAFCLAGQSFHSRDNTARRLGTGPKLDCAMRWPECRIIASVIVNNIGKFLMRWHHSETSSLVSTGMTVDL